MEICPEDSVLVPVSFSDGHLGVTLRRRQEEGIIYIHDIVAESQAVNLDVQVGDELWGVGDSVIGLACVDKDAWNGLVQFIKTSPRPLKTTWRRRIATPTSPPESGIIDECHSLAGETKSDRTLSKASVNSDSPISVDPRTTSNEIETAVANASSPEGEVVELPETMSALAIDDEEYENEMMLQQFSTRLFTKPKEKSGNIISNFFSRGAPADESLIPYPLARNGRQLLKYGELMVVNSGNGRLTLRTVLVLSDILLIAEPLGNGNLLIETIIDLQVCKLRVVLFPFDPHFITHLSAVVAPDRCSHVFELISPAASITIMCASSIEREMWSDCIVAAITRCDIHLDAGVGSRHQHMLGTIYSAVLGRDETLLKEIVLSCESGQLDQSIIDMPDEEGFTPLHYAVIWRHHSLVRILAEAHANAGIPDARSGRTAIHWAAAQLDDAALAVVARPYSFDIDLTDNEGATPLYLACTGAALTDFQLSKAQLQEGRYHDRGQSALSQATLTALSDCARRLLDAGADPNVGSSSSSSVGGIGVPLIYHLAASWKADLVALFVNHKVDILSFEKVHGMSALHHAARGIPLNPLTGEVDSNFNPSSPNSPGSSSSSSNSSSSSGGGSGAGGFGTATTRGDGAATLSALLRAGARPNARDIRGKSALHVLAEHGEAMWGGSGSVAGAVRVLVAAGARFDDSPQCQFLRTKLDESELQDLFDDRAAAPAVDVDGLGINVAEFPKATNLTVHPPEGNNGMKDKSTVLCILCSVNFTLFRRQHHCRLCEVLCCDDCSKRRAVVAGSPVRTCDPCFNRLSSLVEQQEASGIGVANSKLRSGSSSNSSASSKLSAAAQSAQKKELFGSAMSPSTSNSSSSSSSAVGRQQQVQSGVAGTMSQMSEAHERLLERGEKLSKLSDRSADLSNAANEFSKLAKQLHDKQKNRWF